MARYVDRRSKCFQTAPGDLTLERAYGRKTLQAIQQLCAGYHRHANNGGLDNRQLCFDLRRTALDDIARDIRVEHVELLPACRSSDRPEPPPGAARREGSHR